MKDKTLVMDMDTVQAGNRRRSLRDLFSVGEFGWIWIGTVLLFVISGIVAPGTLSKASLFAMLPFAGILAIVSIGQTIVVQQRGLDMSAAGMVSLAGVVAAELGYLSESIFIGLFGTLILAAAIGMLNGFLAARINITPLVATLATNALLIGGVRSITGNAPITMQQSIQDFSHSDLFGLPYSLWLAVLFVVLVAVVMQRTIAGRRFVAVGVNPQAAMAAGVVAVRYQVGAYVVSALCFTVGGILLAGFIGSASHTAGNDYLLPAIAAVVVGGTPLTGGRGSVIASAVAALFMVQLDQMVLALGAGAAVQLLVQAGAILAATMIRMVPALLRQMR